MGVGRTEIGALIAESKPHVIILNETKEARIQVLKEALQGAAIGKVPEIWKE